MPAFQVQVSHGLGQAVALQRLKELVQRSLDRFRADLSAADGSWTENVLAFCLTTTGVTVRGTLVVAEQHVRIDGQLPLIAWPLRGTIQKSLAAELAQALE